MWQWGATAGENILDKLHGWDLVGFTRACFIVSIFLALGGCGAANLASVGSVAPADSMDTMALNRQPDLFLSDPEPELPEDRPR